MTTVQNVIDRILIVKKWILSNFMSMNNKTRKLTFYHLTSVNEKLLITYLSTFIRE